MFKQQFLQKLENLLNQGKHKYYTIEETNSTFLIKHIFDDKCIVELDCQNKRIVVSEPIGELYAPIEELFKQLEFEYKIVIEIYGEFYETKNILEQNGFIVLAEQWLLVRPVRKDVNYAKFCKIASNHKWRNMRGLSNATPSGVIN